MLIKIKELVPGMVLGRDLVDRGFSVLRKGAELSEAMISTIKKRGIANVDIDDDGALAVASQNQQVFKFAGEEYDIFMEKKRVLEKLFAGLAQGDGQMQMLKYCVMGQLEESFDNDQR